MAAAVPSQSYSTIWSFFQAVHGLNRSWPVYTGDFLPYGTVVLPAWWTGAFIAYCGCSLVNFLSYFCCVYVLCCARIFDDQATSRLARA